METIVFNSALFATPRAKKTTKSSKPRLSEEEATWRRELRKQLKDLETKDTYCLTKGEISANWVKAQQIRCILGMKYETYNPYAN